MKIQMTPWYDHFTFHVEVPGDSPENPIVKRFSFHSDRAMDDVCNNGLNIVTSVNSDFVYAPEFYRPWTPDKPQFTSYTIEAGGETVSGRFGFTCLLVGQPAGEDAHYHLNGFRYFLNAVRLSSGKPDKALVSKLKDHGFNALFTDLTSLDDTLLDYTDELGFYMIAEGEFASQSTNFHPSFVNWNTLVNPLPGMERPISFEISSVDEMFSVVLPQMMKAPGQSVLTIALEDIDKLDKDRVRLYYRTLSAVINFRQQDTDSAKQEILDKINSGDFTHLHPGEVNPGTVLILGDSISDFFPSNILLADYRLFNRGFSGNRTDQLLDAIPRTAAVLNPEKIFLLIGTNDIGHGVMLPDTLPIWDQIAAELKKYCPLAEVHVLTPIPTNQGVHWEHPLHFEFTVCRPNSLITKYDETILPVVCERYGWQLHPIAEPFKDENGNMALPLTAEGLHLCAAGNIVYMNEFRKILGK